jgi:hypothetical protein
MTAVNLVDFLLQMATVIGEITSDTETDMAPNQPGRRKEMHLFEL